MPDLFDYKVKWGDTLSDLAKAYHTTVDNILLHNPRVKHRDPTGNTIYANEVIKLPKIPTVPVAPKPPVIPPAPKIPKIPKEKPVPAPKNIFDYKIKPGDTLSDIAKQFHVNIKDVQKWNKIPDINKIQAGKILKLPKTPGLPKKEAIPSEFSVTPSKKELGQTWHPTAETINKIPVVPKTSETTPETAAFKTPKIKTSKIKLPKVEAEGPTPPTGTTTPPTTMTTVPKPKVKVNVPEPKLFDLGETIKKGFNYFRIGGNNVIRSVDDFYSNHFMSKEAKSQYEKFKDWESLIKKPIPSPISPGGTAPEFKTLNPEDLRVAQVPTTIQKETGSTTAILNIGKFADNYKPQYTDKELEDMQKKNVPLPDKDTAAQAIYYRQKQEMKAAHELSEIGLLTDEEAKNPTKFFTTRTIKTKASHPLSYYAKLYDTTESRLHALNPHIILKVNVPAGSNLVLPPLLETRLQDKVKEIVAKFQGNLNSPLLLEYVSKTEAIQKQLEDLQQANLGDFLGDLSAFVMDSKNFHNAMEKSEAKELSELIGQKAELEQLNTNLASQQLLYKKYAPEIQKLNKDLPRFKQLGDTLQSEITPELKGWLDQWSNFDKLSDTDKKKLAKYYLANKTTIDKVLNDIKEYQGLRVEVEANKDLIDQIQRFQTSTKVNDNAAVKIPFADLIQSKAFNDVLSLYSRRSAHPKTKIVKILLKSYKTMQWLKDHDAEVKIQASQLSDAKQKMFAEINVYQQETSNAIENFVNQKHLEIKAQEDYQKYAMKEAISEGTEQSEAMKLLLRGANTKYENWNAPRVYINLLRKSTWQGHGKNIGVFLLKQFTDVATAPLDIKGSFTKYYKDNDPLLKRLTLRPLEGVNDLMHKFPILLPKALWESNKVLNIIGFNIVIPAVQSAIAETLNSLSWLGYEGYAGVEKLLTGINVKKQVTWAQTRDLIWAGFNFPMHSEKLPSLQFDPKTYLDESYYLANIFNPFTKIPDFHGKPLIMRINPKAAQRYEAGKASLEKKTLQIGARYFEDIEYYAPTFNQKEKTTALQRAISPFTSYMKGKQFHSFKLRQDVSIKDLYSDAWTNNLDDFIAMNPKVKDVMAMKKGTIITMRDYQSGDPFKILPEEQRLAFKLKYPVQYELYSNIIEQVFEYPFDLAGEKFITLLRGMVGTGSIKLMYKFGTLSEKHAWAQKAAQAVWFGDQMSKVLRGVETAGTETAVPAFIRSPYILKVAVPSIKDLSRIRRTLSFTSAVSHMPYPVRKMFASMSDAMRGQIDVIEDQKALMALSDVAKSYGIKESEFSKMIASALTDQGVEPIEAVANYMNRVGISVGELWGIAKNTSDPLTKKLLKGFVKRMADAKSKTSFVTENFIRKVKQAPRNVQDGFTLLTKSTPQTYDEYLGRITKIYGDPKVAAQAAGFYKEYKELSLRALADYNKVPVRLNLGKNWEAKFIEEPDPLKRAKIFPHHQRYIIQKSFKDPDKYAILFNALEYHDVSDMVADVYRISSQKIMDELGDFTAYSMTTARPYNQIEIANRVRGLKRGYVPDNSRLPNNLAPLAGYEAAIPTTKAGKIALKKGMRPKAWTVDFNTLIGADTQRMLKRTLKGDLNEIHHILNRVLPPEVIEKEYTSSWVLNFYDRSLNPFGDLTGISPFELVKNKRRYLNRYLQYQELAQEIVSLKRFRLENPAIFKEYRNYLQTKIPVTEFITKKSSTWESLAKMSKTSPDHLKFMNPTLKNTKILKAGQKVLLPNLTPAEELDAFILFHPNIRPTELQTLLFSSHELTGPELQELRNIVNQSSKEHVNTYLARLKKTEFETYAKSHSIVIDPNHLPRDLKIRWAKIKSATHAESNLTPSTSADLLTKLHKEFLLEPRALETHHFLKAAYPLLKGEKAPFEQTLAGVHLKELRDLNLKRLHGLESKNTNNIIVYNVEANKALRKNMSGKVWIPTSNELSNLSLDSRTLNKIKAAIKDGKKVVFVSETPKGQELLKWFKAHPEYQAGVHYSFNNRKSFFLKSSYTPGDFVKTLKKQFPEVYESVSYGGMIPDEDVVKLFAASKSLPKKVKYGDFLPKYKTVDTYNDIRTIDAAALTKTKRGQNFLANFTKANKKHITTNLEQFQAASSADLRRQITKYYWTKGELGKAGLNIFETDEGIDFIYRQNELIENLKSVMGIGNISLKLSGEKVVGVIPTKINVIPIRYSKSGINYLEEMSARQAGGKYLFKPTKLDIIDKIRKSMMGEVGVGSDTSNSLIELLGTMRNWTGSEDYLKQLKTIQQLKDQLSLLNPEYTKLNGERDLLHEWGIGKYHSRANPTKIGKLLDDAAKKGLIKPIKYAKKNILDQQRLALLTLAAKNKINHNAQLVLDILKSQTPDQLSHAANNLFTKMATIKTDLTEAYDKLAGMENTFDGIVARKSTSIEPERILLSSYSTKAKALDPDFVKSIEKRKLAINTALKDSRIPAESKKALKDELKRIKAFEPHVLAYQIAAEHKLLPTDSELTQLLSNIVPDSYKAKLSKLQSLLGDKKAIIKSYKSLGLYNPKIEGSVLMEHGHSIQNLNKMFPDAQTELPTFRTIVFNPVKGKTGLEDLAIKLRKLQREGITTIVDRTGLLPDLLKRSGININIKVVSKDVLPSISMPGETMTLTQKKIINDFRKLYFNERKIAFVASTKDEAKALENMMLEYRTPIEKQFIHNLYIEHQQLVSLSRGEVVHGDAGFALTRSPTTKFLPWDKSLKKNLNETYSSIAVKQLEYDVSKPPWAQKLVVYKNPYKQSGVLLVGTDSPVITHSVQEHLDDALSQGCTFFRFKTINPGEESMIEYLKRQAKLKGIKMPKIQIIPDTPKMVKTIVGMPTTGLPVFVLSSTNNPKYLVSLRKELYEKLDPRNRVYVGLTALKDRYRDQLIKLARAFKSDPQKFLPYHYVQLVAYDKDPTTWIANWMGTLKKEKLKDTWIKFKANLYTQIRDEVENDVKQQLGLTKLDPVSRQLVSAQIESIKTDVDSLDSLLGMSPKKRWSFRRMMAERLDMKTKNAAGISSVLGVPMNLETWSPVHESLANFIATKGYRILGTSINIWKKFRSAWIHSIMLLRLAWHVRNAIDDGLRQAYGAQDTKLFFEILAGYGDLTRRFGMRLGADFTNIIGETLGSYYWGKHISKWWKRIFGENAVPEYITKAYRFEPVDIVDVYSPREIQNWSSHYGTAIKWRMPGSKPLLSPTGELVTPEDVGFGARSGFYSQYSDPVISRMFLERMDDLHYFKRIGRRFTLFDIDTQYYAEFAEETRRLMMYHDLIWDKGINMAKAEALVKYWSFDYSDIDRASQLARKLFPFFTFNRKNVEVWLKAAAYDPRIFRAAKTLLRTWSVAAQHLPATYNQTIPIGKNVYWKLPFGFADILSFFQDPFRSLQEMMDNPARMPFGLSWDPEISVALQLALKKNYFSTTENVKREYGFSDYEAKQYLEKKHQKDIDLSTGPDAWIKLSLDTVPFGEFFHSLYAMDTSFAFREKTIMDSKIIKQLFKLCGFNIKHYDKIAKVVHVYFTLRPAERKIWLDRMKRSEPNLYGVLMDYFAINDISKVMAASPKDKKDALENLKKSGVIGTFNTLEDMNPGQGYVWLGRMVKTHPEYKKIIDDWFESIQITPSRLEGRSIGKEIEMKSIIKQLLKPIPSKTDKTRLGRYKILGIMTDYTGDFTKEQLYHDLTNPDGSVKYPTVAEMNIVLGENWEKHGIPLVDKKLIQKAKDQAAEWRYKANTAKRIKDKKYAYHLAMVYDVIPDNLDQLSEKQQQPIWDQWHKHLNTYLTPDELKRYRKNLPAEQKAYQDAMTNYISTWKKLRDKIDYSNKHPEIKYNYFTDFFSQPKVFKELYFYNHPDKKLWYDFQYESETRSNAIDKHEHETFKYDSEARKAYSEWFWSHEDLLKAHDKEKPGYYKRMLGWKHLRDITEDDPQKYYPAFAKQPKDWIASVYKADPEKAIYYPFMIKWSQLMDLDQQNLKKGKRTHLASDYFWLPRNKQARELYSKNHLPIAKGVSILDYFSVWHKFWERLGPITKGDEETYFNKYFKLFSIQPKWFINYFLNSPGNENKKIYYPFRISLAGLTKEEFLKEFWKPKWLLARLAWDRDDPGFLNYMKFWKRLGALAEIKKWKAYFGFYYAAQNSAARARYKKNNPSGAAYMDLLYKYMRLPTDRWEDRKAKRAFVKSHPELEKHWDKDISAEDAKMRDLAEKYYDIKDSIEDNGSGQTYFKQYRKSKVMAKQYLKDHPELAVWFSKQVSEYGNKDPQLQNLLTEYENLTFPEERNRFVTVHPMLGKYFYYSNPPGIRKVLDLQNIYFKLPKERRGDYLKAHPNLLEWWEVTKLPSSYWTNPTKFREVQNNVTKVYNYYNAYLRGDYKLAETLFNNLPHYYQFQLDSEEAKWFRLKVYGEAMKTWTGIKEWIHSIYFFRQLPRWIRDEYFKHHPSSKLLSYMSLHRFMEEPLIENYPAYKDAIRSTKFIYHYKHYRDMPYQVQNEYRRMMTAKGVWPDRKGWDKGDWYRYWQNETLRKNRIRAEDLARLPLLRAELSRAIKDFILRPNPKPFQKKIRGAIQPFF